MNRAGRSHPAGIFSRVVALGLFAALCWPAAAAAESGQCSNLEEMADYGLATTLWGHSGEISSTDARSDEVPGEVRETPCEASEEADDRSASFCFEEADGQVSTLPSLLAKTRAEQKAGEIARAAADTAEPSPARLAETKASVPVDDSGDSASCSEEPDKCRALPPLPPTLTLEGSTASARDDARTLDTPVELTPDNPPAWARLRVGPNEGHSHPPDRPPGADLIPA